MLDYIDGYNFSQIAHFRIDRDNWDLTTELFRKNAIIYCKTDFLEVLFRYVGSSARKYILISHMSDLPITSGRSSFAPPSIKKWFAQNSTYTHPDIIPIPTGLENHAGGCKGPFTDHEWFSESIEELRNNKKEPILYCHWNPANSHYRAQVVDILRGKNEVIHQEARLDYRKYCTGISKYKYIVCPPGNGVDTLRVWESLYMGCTPVVLRHRIFSSMNLPIIQVDRWEDITPELLKNYKWDSDVSSEPIYMEYWRKRIIREFEEL